MKIGELPKAQQIAFAHIRGAIRGSDSLRANFPPITLGFHQRHQRQMQGKQAPNLLVETTNQSTSLNLRDTNSINILASVTFDPSQSDSIRLTTPAEERVYYPIDDEFTIAPGYPLTLAEEVSSHIASTILREQNITNRSTIFQAWRNVETAALLQVLQKRFALSEFNRATLPDHHITTDLRSDTTTCDIVYENIHAKFYFPDPSQPNQSSQILIKLNPDLYNPGIADFLLRPDGSYVGSLDVVTARNLAFALISEIEEARAKKGQGKQIGLKPGRLSKPVENAENILIAFCQNVSYRGRRLASGPSGEIRLAR